MATFLQDTDSLIAPSSKVIALACLTKLWLNSPSIPPTFVGELSRLTRDVDQLPHLRTVASHSLYEIRTRRPEAFTLSADEVLDAASSITIPTAYPTIALGMTGRNDRLDDLYTRRSWCLSPFEVASTASVYRPSWGFVPADPLLLHLAVVDGGVPKSSVLTMMNSPLMQFGVSSVLLAFTEAYEFAGNELFSPFDSREQIAAKCALLPAALSSVESGPLVTEFAGQSADTPIVLAVFRMASGFDSSDLFEFYRRFYPDSPHFDDHWLRLYAGQTDVVKKTLRCFLSGFPGRPSAARILLESDDKLPTLAVITELNDESLLPLLPKHSGTEAALLTAAKLDTFANTPTVKAMRTTTDVRLLPLLETRHVLKIVDSSVTTTNRNTTVVVLSLESLTDPLFAVSFTISNPDFFEADAVASVPLIQAACSIQFTLVPRKAGLCAMRLTVVYTTAAGESFFFRLLDDPHLIIQPVAFLSGADDVDFGTVWEGGEESRVLSPLKFPQFVEAFAETVFGPAAQREPSSVQAVAWTPDGKAVAVRAVAHTSGTTVKFKAPTIELLTLVDDFLRRLAKPQ
jgi:hypothetical protein